MHIFVTIHHICVDALLSYSGAALRSLLSLDLLQKASTFSAVLTNIVVILFLVNVILLE